jgi:hypothetical protein
MASALYSGLLSYNFILRFLEKRRVNQQLLRLRQYLVQVDDGLLGHGRCCEVMPQFSKELDDFCGAGECVMALSRVLSCQVDGALSDNNS